MNTLVAQFHMQYSQFHLKVALDIPLDGLTAVFGPSGCGKTTLLSCIAGLKRSKNGVVKFRNSIWQDEAQGKFLPISKRPIGYVFQEPRLFPHLSVRANLDYGLKRITKDKQKLSLEEIVEILDLYSLLDRRPNSLSGGEQQRVAIGRALLTSPEILLMDEPLSSLDLKRKRELLPTIQRLNKDLRIPILYVSHDIHEILQIASQAILMKNGNVMAVGPMPAVFASQDLSGLIEPYPVGAILETRIVEHEPTFGLTRVEFLGRSIFIPQQSLQIGSSLRVQILARDVSIVVGRQAVSSSVLNVLEATIVNIGKSTDDKHAVEVKLDVGCHLLALITKKSFYQLNLQPGQKVYAHFKAVALG